MVVTGRTLDEVGNPIRGTGFEFDGTGPLADLLRERVGPLRSHPTREVWSAPLERPQDGSDRLRLLSVYGSDYEGPPEHYHEVSEERFDIRQGTFTFEIEGEHREVPAGETVTVPTGVRHTFSYAGPRGVDSAPSDPLGVSVTDVEPPGRIGRVFPTFGGIAHDERRSEDDPFQRAIIAKRLEGDTVFTEQDSLLADVATNVLAPLARLRGYQGAYATYQQPAFWERHVEQPEL